MTNNSYPSKIAALLLELSTFLSPSLPSREYRYAIFAREWTRGQQAFLSFSCRW
jgi:hypothetical protein